VAHTSLAPLSPGLPASLSASCRARRRPARNRPWDLSKRNQLGTGPYSQVMHRNPACYGNVYAAVHFIVQNFRRLQGLSTNKSFYK
jgi:hypothetical protein